MAQTKQHQLAGVTELFRRSYELVRENLNLFILLYAVPALFAVWSSLSWFTDDKTTWTDERLSLSNWFGSFSGLNVETPAGLGAGLAFLLGITAVIFGLLQVILALRVSSGKKVELGDIWEEFKQKGFRLFLLEIALGILILVGLVLLIIPGIILFWRLFLAPFILLDKNTGVEEALRQSWRSTKGFAWPIYAVLLFGILLSLSGIIPFIGAIVSFVLGVAYACAPALRYWELKKIG